MEVPFRVDLAAYIMSLVKTKQLSIILGVSDRWVRQLEIDGVIKAHDPVGRLFDAEAAKHAYLNFKLRKLKAKGLV
jgi:hypothetical protein